MRVAVTGSAGFVGRHVIAQLERRRISPTLVTRPGSPMPEGSSGDPVVAMDIGHAPGDA